MMRYVLGVLLCVAGACYASDTAPAGQTVRLFTPADLEKLRSSNPDHYQRAEKLISAANSYCPIGKPVAQSADLRSDQVACGHLDMTSNPPKREISFNLDGTHYIALVTLTASPAKPVPAGR
jgi:hypothetical protein